MALQMFSVRTPALAASAASFSRVFTAWMSGILRELTESLGTHTTGIAALDTRLDAAEAFIAADKYAVTCVIDGHGAAIAAGGLYFARVPRTGTITGWDVVADVSGSIVVDVWHDSFANFPPTTADSIAGTEKPTLSAAQNNQNPALSSWAAAVTAGDYVCFKVDSAATVTWVLVTLIVDPT